LFDYQCGKCGHEREVLVKTSDDEVWCPKCDMLMRKMITSPSNFHLKGQGWFKDGYSYNKENK
jgi:putative FmdB family regulatory protein